MLGKVGAESTSVVLRLAVEQGVAVAARGESAVAVRVVKVIGVVRTVVAVAAVHAGVVIVVTGGIVVVHVDSLVGLVVVGSHGKGSLVGVDVVATANLAAVVARETAVEVVVLQGVGTEKSGSYPEETVVDT